MARGIEFAHLGQPHKQTIRAARQWKRENTYYLTRGEQVRPEVLADPPACFTEQEWRSYLQTLPYEGFRLADSPYIIQNETPDEQLERQKRATRASACSDCMLERQMRAEEEGVCHPSPYNNTPRRCSLPMRGAEGCPDHGHYCMTSIRQALTEGSTDGAAPRSRTGEANVLREKGVPE